MGGAFKKHDPATYRVAIAYVKKRLLKNYLQSYLLSLHNLHMHAANQKKKPMLYYFKWQTLHLAPAEPQPNDAANNYTFCKQLRYEKNIQNMLEVPFPFPY